MLKRLFAHFSGISGQGARAKLRGMLTRFILLYVCIVLGLAVMQRSVLYHPTQDMKLPKEYGLPMEVIPLKAEDGVALTAWYKRPGAGQKVIVYFHGNALHLGARRNKFNTYIQSGFGLMALSYRGFGTSEGSPSEQGLYADARAAIRYVIDSGVPESQIVLYGESLGTGVATQMATEFKNIAALVLEAPYTSVVNRAQELFFYVPVSLVLRDRYETIDKIALVTAPVLFFHGDRDEVIPIEHGKALFEVTKAPKLASYYPGVHHTDFPWQAIAEEMKDFLRKHDR